MIRTICAAASLLLAAPLMARGGFQKDTIKTSEGNLESTLIGHASLVIEWAGKVLHIDPWSRLADYTLLPKADLILITHHHGDHFDLKAIEEIRKATTVVVFTKKCAEELKAGTVMNNGDIRKFLGITIEAVPAYNLLHRRPDGTPFHPRGEGNGYILTFGKTRVYVAGDTENTPEMKALKGIDIAFLPMNLPYTMTPEMVADAAKAFRPHVLYPYHYGETDPAKLIEALKGEKGMEVRIRPMR